MSISIDLLRKFCYFVSHIMRRKELTLIAVFISTLTLAQTSRICGYCAEEKLEEHPLTFVPSFLSNDGVVGKQIGKSDCNEEYSSVKGMPVVECAGRCLNITFKWKFVGPTVFYTEVHTCEEYHFNVTQLAAYKEEKCYKKRVNGIMQKLCFCKDNLCNEGLTNVRNKTTQLPVSAFYRKQKLQQIETLHRVNETNFEEVKLQAENQRERQRLQRIALKQNGTACTAQPPTTSTISIWKQQAADVRELIKEHERWKKIKEEEKLAERKALEEKEAARRKAAKEEAAKRKADLKAAAKNKPIVIGATSLDVISYIVIGFIGLSSLFFLVRWGYLRCAHCRAQKNNAPTDDIA
ncbi:hypothetical protein L596_027062 [Steinernema carpocapsae]|uniref:Uncharacterized protein n=1 Tax=Steinernema carpocapsae TaxID=34508 RepID=A0A4U5M446_STECR|nr:hypothetical protein L596_027062 [Steinernema carpocapsae]